MKLLQRLINWFTHRHQWHCTRKPDETMGSEKYYWHIHTCDDCPKTKSVMNGGCAQFHQRKKG